MIPLTKVLAVLALVAPSAAPAAIVSGTHYTSVGKLVALQNLEWLSLDSTRGLSRLEIEQGALGYSTAGWRYATRLETSTLLMSLWGGAYLGGSYDNGDGAEWFFRNIGQGNIQYGDAVLRNFFYGATGECSSDQSLSCHGLYGVSFSNVGNPPTGWFYAEYGLDWLHISPQTVVVSEQDSRFGHLLVRGNSVPEPGTLGLTLLSFVLLARLWRRKSAA